MARAGLYSSRELRAAHEEERALLDLQQASLDCGQCASLWPESTVQR